MFVLIHNSQPRNFGSSSLHSQFITALNFHFTLPPSPICASELVFSISILFCPIVFFNLCSCCLEGSHTKVSHQMAIWIHFRMTGFTSIPIDFLYIFSAACHLALVFFYQISNLFCTPIDFRIQSGHPVTSQGSLTNLCSGSSYESVSEFFSSCFYHISCFSQATQLTLLHLLHGWVKSIHECVA